MGFLSGWWLGDEDNRANEPYVSPERWSRELVAAGFKQPDAMVLDIIAPYQQCVTILASPDIKVRTPPRVSLLCWTRNGPYVEEMQSKLNSLAIAVDICIFGQQLPNQDVLCLLDLERPTIHDLSQDSFQTLVGYLKVLETRMIWATRSAQVRCEDPRFAMTLGFTRTARTDLSAKLFTVEIDNSSSITAATQALADILLRVQMPELDADSMAPDWEYAVVNGKVLVPRMHWQTVTDAFTQIEDYNNRPSTKSLTVTTPGLLETIGWREAEREKLGYGEVVVQTRAVGLNFKDVLIALGALDNSMEEMGLEGSGVITEIGPGVDKLVVGDRVLYASIGCFTTRKTVSETLCVKMDDCMTFEQGAAIPSVYLTVIVALVDKANLKQGQTVLIHSACGGVGLAAVQIANMVGAEIYCTVSTQKKASYLVKNHGIQPSHIFQSRDSSFLGDIMRATNNRGVDAVLNSLSGHLLDASWKCVAKFGTLIEIGKRDFRRRAKLAMEVFEDNRTFVGLDVSQLCQAQPEKAAEVLKRCIGWMRSGKIKPASIAKVCEAEQIEEAFRFMQKGAHIGKMIVRMPQDMSSLKSVKDIACPSLRANGCYLLVGGLGGLGRAIATWLVEYGARHLMFLSRSASANPEAGDFIDELSSQGCQVQLVAGNVAIMADVKRAVQAAAKPIAGVVNLSMVLKVSLRLTLVLSSKTNLTRHVYSEQDISLKEMSFADWNVAVEPKVQGTWNLHKALSPDLDFFILSSSISGIVGQHGQANYAAGNTFLDAFVQYRHQKGLAASVIDIGSVGDVGYTSKNPDVLDKLRKLGAYILHENDLVEAINLAIQRSRPGKTAVLPHRAYWNPSQIILGLVTTAPLASLGTSIAWKKDVRMSIYHSIHCHGEAVTKASAERDVIDSLLTHAQKQPSILKEEGTTTVIATAIMSALANILTENKGNIKVQDSPANAGLDSLVAMQMRIWIRDRFGVDMTVLTMLQSSSFLNLGEHVQLALSKRFLSQG
ncbi:hypothetical protein CDD82_4894 [Ophiocordyceps australis]|uniref:Carrier domain-containing protein n=1 Tax=Ophiocordyceps australis TaxID=1399860 RepID=A0A2C5Z3G3_9HYPO|nr:hypothetical protein CDD82_4894 [Ophiocordyceps australis]